MSNQVNSRKKGLTVKDLVTTGIFSAIFFVFTLVGGLPFAPNPVLTFYMPMGAALLCGPIYLLMVAKVQKRWSVTILGIIMGIIWFATGMHWAFSLGYIGMGIIADLVAGAGHYRNKAINLLSYILISLGGIYTYVVFFIDPEGWASTMLENGTEQSYIDTMSASAPSWLLAVIIECGMLLMVPIGGMFFLKGSLAAGAFLLFVYVGSMYLTEIRPLQELGTNFANVLNAVTKTKEILDIPIYEGGTDFPKNHDIELRNVRFSYDGKTDVLQGVNLKIKDGERMALVGQSGAGKSTVIELISRFYDVQEGEVLIGGKNVKELDYDTILKNVAIVFQKTFLTRDSVLENIRMGSSASLEEVRAAAKEAQIDDFIMSLPDGYDTKVGSFGSRFSGGEKQRIAIARAILKNAPILILDEATSASDPENQMEIDKAIQNLCRGKTVIVVAHRLSALKLCDRVAVVENHTITCIGTHEEVRRKNAYYRKAWEDYEKARNITYQLEGGEGNG